MAQVTEDVCRRIIEDTERGYSTGLTQWERCQLAWAWLKLNGHEAPNEINIRPRLELIQRPTQETRAAPEVECCNAECTWRGMKSDTVHPKHAVEDMLCPECHEVIEAV